MRSVLTTHLIGVFLLFLALIMLLIGLGHPDEMVFDETHYVPAARDLLTLSRNNNPEHPLFAKEMIAAGIAVFGDTPFGWRAFGAIFTAFGIFSAYHIARKLFQSVPLAVLTAILLLTSITVTIQARTAMLDTYTYPLLTISAGFLIWSSGINSSRLVSIGLLALAAVFLGLAAGAKWIAGIYAMITLVGLLVARAVAVIRSGRSPASFLFGQNFPSWPTLNLLSAGLIMGVVSLSTYFATFLPLLFLKQDPLSASELISFQFHMLDRQTLPLAFNSYESDWWLWPVMLEPIWYHFQDSPEGGHEALFYVGNPVIFWGGLVALELVIIGAVWQRNMTALWTAIAFVASWRIYEILPKQIGFFFYYHGSGMLLCFVIPAAIYLIPKGKLRGWTIALTGIASSIAFIFFFPVVYATEMPTDRWTQYLLLKSWK